MICNRSHRFEGWFGSRQQFDSQVEAGLVQCPVCGSTETRKIATASRINTSSAEHPEAQASNEPAQVEAEVLGELIRYVVDHTEDVGSAFPEEARRIHYHEISRRQIRGTASRQEVDDLKEEGINVMSLPFPIPGKIH